MQAHAKIVSALRSGDRDKALAEANQLLSANPRDSDLLGLKALALASAARLDEAVECASLAVSHAQNGTQRFKHAGNLARLLVATGRVEDLVALVQRMLLQDGKAEAGEADPVDLEIIGAFLLKAEKFELVARLLDPVLDDPRASWNLEQHWLCASSRLGQHEKIEARLESPAYRWRDRPEALGFACAAAGALKKEAESNRLYNAYLAAAPIYAAPRVPSQVLSIILISQNPRVEHLAYPASEQHFRANFPSQLARRRADRYRFFSVFLGSPTRPITAEFGALGASVILNNCVNGETLRGRDLAKVQAHEKALGFPLVNAAEQAVHCTRVETAETLRGIQNLIVPKALRFRLEAKLLPSLQKGVRETFGLPVLLRTVGEQGGRNIHFASTDTELATALENLLAMGNKQFYAIEYVGVPHEKGLFRRFRAAYVNGTPTLMRVDYDAQWMVKGRKNTRIQEHYRHDPALLTHADALVRNPESIGAAATSALREIGRRVPLDVFGIDFDVDHDGRVVFFEANATMNLLSTAPKGFEYPSECEDQFLAQLDAFLMKRAGAGLQ